MKYNNPGYEKLRQIFDEAEEDAMVEDGTFGRDAVYAAGFREAQRILGTEFALALWQDSDGNWHLNGMGVLIDDEEGGTV